CSSRGASTSTSRSGSATSRSSGALPKAPRPRRSSSTPTTAEKIRLTGHMSDELLPVEEQIAAFKRAIEAVILVSHDPVPTELLAQLLEQPLNSVEQWCDELAAEYAEQQRGFELRRVAGGFRYQTHPD